MFLNILKAVAASNHGNVPDDVGLGNIPAITYRHRRIIFLVPHLNPDIFFAKDLRTIINNVAVMGQAKTVSIERFGKTGAFQQAGHGFRTDHLARTPAYRTYGFTNSRIIRSAHFAGHRCLNSF
jgi:hypothetical protein